MKTLQIKGKKVEQTSTNITSDIAEAIASPLHEMTEAITTEVTAELGKVDSKFTAFQDKITADLDEKNEVIADLKTTIEALTADIAAQKGKQTTDAAGNTGYKIPEGVTLIASKE